MSTEIPETADEIVEKAKAADQKFCFSCGVLLHHSATACPKCGAVQPVHKDMAVSPYRPAEQATSLQPVAAGTLPPHHVFCRGCAAHIHESAPTCPKCGAVQRVNTSGTSVASAGKDRVTAALLAILLGSFGAHRFYLGHVGLGFLYLIFFWTWIPGIVGVIEGIIYLTQSDQEFKSKYN